MVAHLRKHPCLRLSIALVGGASFGTFFEAMDDKLVLWTFVGALLLAVFLHSAVRFGRSGYLAGLAIVFSVFLLGCYVYLSQLPCNDKNHYVHFIQDYNELYFQVKEIRNKRAYAEVLRLNEHSVHGRVVLYFGAIESGPTAGDVMYVSTRIESIPHPQNPGAFNYRRYYRGKQIYHQAFLRDPPILLEQNQGNLWERYPREWRRYFSAALTAYIDGSKELALCQALLLGDKRLLPQDLKAAFVDAGTMHILAVSGLHLGIIYLILNALFSLIKSNLIFIKILRSLLIILCLWTFALIVGGSASVVRAATMFSLFEFSKVILRKNYSLNSLSLAALGLVLVDPMSILDVGFQLSFLALLGILICQKHVERLWVVEHRWGHKLWQMISLSFAAQLFTFPLSIYYFNEFPIYFWLSGIVAIPLAFLLLALGFGFFVFHSIPILAVGLSYALSKTAWLLNTWIYLIQRIPGVSFEGLYIDIYQVLFLLVLSVLVATMLVYREGKYVLFVLISIISCQAYDMLSKINLASHAEFVAYSLSYGSRADLFVGRQVYSIYPSSSDTLIPYDVKRYRNARQAKVVTEDSISPKLFSREGFLKVGDWVCHIVTDRDFLLTNSFPKVDVLWLKTPVPLDDQIDLLRDRVGEILLDRALPYAYAEHLSKLIGHESLDIHQMRIDGAYRKVIEP